MKEESVAYIRVVADIPRSMHKRLKKMCGVERFTMSNLIYECLRDRVQQYENRQKEAQQLPQSRLTKLKQLVPIDQRKSTGYSLDENLPDKLSTLFENHARRMLEAYERPVDFAKCQQEAFAEIRKYSPIRYREDDRIKERLDKIITEWALRGELPQPSAPQPPIVTPPAEPINLLRTIADVLKKTPTPPTPPEDPMLGKSLPKTRIKKSSVLTEDE